jgi:hypothetical protein
VVCIVRSNTSSQLKKALGAPTRAAPIPTDMGWREHLEAASAVVAKQLGLRLPQSPRGEAATPRNRGSRVPTRRQDAKALSWADCVAWGPPYSERMQECEDAIRRDALNRLNARFRDAQPSNEPEEFGAGVGGRSRPIGSALWPYIHGCLDPLTHRRPNPCNRRH